MRKTILPLRLNKPVKVDADRIIDAIHAKAKRDNFWSSYGRRVFSADPWDCDHPRGLDDYLSGGIFPTRVQACRYCGWLKCWPPASK